MEEKSPLMEMFLKKVPPGILGSDTTIPARLTPEERARIYNEESKAKNPDGADVCPICYGRGSVAVVKDGVFVTEDCMCKARRRTLERARKCGMGDVFERYTLERFRTDRPWQAELKRSAEAFLAKREGWMFVSGRSGSGKSHITCAVARELLLDGLSTEYFTWRDNGRRLKARTNLPEYDEEIRRYKDCRVLVIDDLWKGGEVTPADVNLAFELLNARCNAAGSITLISSERNLNEITGIDEAVGGRICERARGFILGTGDADLRLAPA